MGKGILTFGDIETEQNTFYRLVNPTFFKRCRYWESISILQVLVSIKSYICYLYNDNKAKPLHIRLPKTRTFVKSYDGQTKLMYRDLLEK